RPRSSPGTCAQCGRTQPGFGPGSDRRRGRAAPGVGARPWRSPGCGCLGAWGWWRDGLRESGGAGPLVGVDTSQAGDNAVEVEPDVGGQRDPGAVWFQPVGGHVGAGPDAVLHDGEAIDRTHDSGYGQHLDVGEPVLGALQGEGEGGAARRVLPGDLL